MRKTSAATPDPPVTPVSLEELIFLTKVFNWADVLKYPSAWNMLTWLATLVALADGLNRVGFVS